MFSSYASVDWSNIASFHVQIRRADWSRQMRTSVSPSVCWRCCVLYGYTRAPFGCICRFDKRVSHARDRYTHNDISSRATKAVCRVFYYVFEYLSIHLYATYSHITYSIVDIVFLSSLYSTSSVLAQHIQQLVSFQVYILFVIIVLVALLLRRLLLLLLSFLCHCYCCVGFHLNFEEHAIFWCRQIIGSLQNPGQIHNGALMSGMHTLAHTKRTKKMWKMFTITIADLNQRRLKN